MIKQGAVFLHGGWRCGSTYIWSRFRKSRHAICFYEPFHETLARCSARKIRRDTSLTWNSRHPPLERPYRDEYLPLLGWRGVRRYHEEFALAQYFPCDERESRDSLRPQVRYLSLLLEHAAEQDKRAILGFSRSLGRAGELKAALGGYHIVVRRNPVQQWLSCRSYRVKEGSVYFELCHFLILALASPGSPAGILAQGLGLPRPPAGRVKRQLEFLREALYPWSEADSYRAFIAVWLLSHALAEPAADLVVDLDHLSGSHACQDSTRARIFEHTGLALDFRDCRIALHDPGEIDVDFAAVERDVARSLRSLRPGKAIPETGMRGQPRASVLGPAPGEDIRESAARPVA